MVKTATFDAADYLNDEETIAAYLTAARKTQTLMCSSLPSATLRGPVAWRNSPRMRVLAVRASIRHSRPARSHAMTRCSNYFMPSA